LGLGSVSPAQHYAPECQPAAGDLRRRRGSRWTPVFNIIVEMCIQCYNSTEFTNGWNRCLRTLIARLTRIGVLDVWALKGRHQYVAVRIMEHWKGGVVQKRIGDIRDRVHIDRVEIVMKWVLPMLSIVPVSHLPIFFPCGRFSFFHHNFKPKVVNRWWHEARTKNYMSASK
jgi:hypothetical protein